MDVIIPYHFTPWTKDLKYALRSLEAFGPQVGKVFIAANKIPGYVALGSRVVHVPYEDCFDDRFKEANIYRKTAEAVKLIAGNDFLYLHDDHFLTKPLRDCFWFDGRMSNKLRAIDPDMSYYRTVKNTMKQLGDPPNYDIHCPMVMQKSIFARLADYDWDKEYGYGLKTLYAHSDPLHYHFETEDLKLRQPYENYAFAVKDREWFSTDDLAWDDEGGMQRFLESLYPNKSKWEK
jgi:hypothetical protein